MVGSNETATKSVGINKSVSRLSVTVGIVDEESGDRVPELMIRKWSKPCAAPRTYGKIVGTDSG